jgi:hypothetical protein
MGIYNDHSRKIRWTAVLLLMVVVLAGCAGIEPYEPRNNREEGPEKGLFTGSQGEWVIVGPKAEETETGVEEKKDGPQESETNPEEKKRPQKPADDEQ